MTVINAIIRILDSYPFQLVLAANLFAFSLPKRREYWVKLLLLALPMFIIYDEGAKMLSGEITSFVLDRAILLLPAVYTAIGLKLCYECTWIESVFCTACAHPVQNIVFNLYWIMKMHFPFEERTPAALPFSLGITAVVYTAVYFIFARRLRQLDRTEFMRRRIILSTAIVTLFLIFFNQRVPGSRWEESVYVSYIIADILALIIQFGMFSESAWEHKYAIVEQLLYAEQKKQQMTAENVELINRKCHDLKHQIAGLKRMQNTPEFDRYIGKIEDAVMFYESAAKTGNETLDLILMDKLLYCQEHRIKFTCVADGEKLKTIEPMDLYALFGNAIDNAIESVSGEPEESRRIISLRVGSRGQFLSIHLENYLGQEVRLSDGLPVTTKKDKDYHGFGMLSMKSIVEKYDGTMTIRTEDHLFRLNILIPLPN